MVLFIDAPRNPVPEIAVSWDGSGAFDGPYDILAGRLISDTLTIQYGREMGQAGGAPLVSSAEWVLDNRDRLLSPDNGSSPIYQLVIPGKPVRIRIILGDFVDYDAPIDYDLATFYDGREPFVLHGGMLATVTNQPTLGTPTASVSCIGHLARLGRQRISTPVYEGKLIHECITIVLDAVNWPVDKRDLALSDTLLDWFWVDNETPLEVLTRLQITEGVPALIWEGADGTLHFENRNYRATVTRATATQMALVDDIDTYGGTPYFFSDIAYDLPYDDLCNRATYKIARRQRAALVQKVWEYGEAIDLTASEVRLVEATMSDPCDGYVTPVLGTDWAVGSGAITSIALENVTAQSVTLRITNGAAPSQLLGVTSDGIQLRAFPIEITSEETVTHSIDTSASIARYDPFLGGPAEREIGGYPELRASYAAAVCDAMVEYFQEVRAVVSIRFMNLDVRHLLQAAARRPSDRIDVSSSPLGLADAGFWIEQIQQRLVPEGLETVFTCGRVIQLTDAGIWDDPGSTWDDPSTLWGR